MFDFSSERFGVLLFPLSRCCGASTAVAAKKFEPPQGQRPSGHRRRSNRKRQQKWRVFLCAARAVVLSRACNEVGHGRSPCAFSRRFCAVKSGAAGGGSFHDLRHTFATMALQNGVLDAGSLLGGLHTGHLRPRHHRRPTQGGTNNGQYPLPCGIDLSTTRSRWGQRLGQEKASSENSNLQKAKVLEIRRFRGLLVRREGFEPPAFWSVARRSIQLS